MYYVIQESFTTAKLAFANYKMRIRSNLASTHLGPETLEEAVQEYINRNTDLYDLPALINVSSWTGCLGCDTSESNVGRVVVTGCSASSQPQHASSASG